MRFILLAAALLLSAPAAAQERLSLNIGGFAPLDLELVRSIATFKRVHGCLVYSEHLSYCADEAHLYDLLPIPFTEEAVRHVAARVRIVQKVMGERIALENASYYAAPGARLTEIEFLTAVLEEADCGLLLDVSNVFVNAVNHGYAPLPFLRALPAKRVWYLHVAGHYVEAPDLRVDTHGADVCPDVWSLLEAAYAHCGPAPTLLERDFNFPPLGELVAEVARVRDLQAAHGGSLRRAAGG